MMQCVGSFSKNDVMCTVSPALFQNDTVCRVSPVTIHHLEVFFVFESNFTVYVSFSDHMSLLFVKQYGKD